MQNEVAHRRLRELILDGTYAPGVRLTEVDAAAALEMSRTPVREALRALAADGLVRTTGRGVVVVALDPGDLEDAYQVRAALEALTAETAATRQRDGRLAPADLTALRTLADVTAETTSEGRLVEAVELNRRFHRRIAELAGNRIALETLNRVWDQIQVSTLRSLKPVVRHAHVSAQHDDLLAAITDGRAQDAGQIARRHVLDTRTTARQPPEQQ
ncbi:GntR family transcriptional regulator [Nonomuraea glycinis]|uniref:GntR family transcriptional regulator n=1 Tax=Nonomuraea glycinis TaxID=2047744 RepID=A0A918A4C3_9ACTN|nr:GntR family transcriptional regulator [Nonomuraea glycinis]MCA2178019.1 GntR family transcriptional regulator [Nonomuraea glycinis]GGP06255.1 GntR family transcriptional regulator [Nonomuraea glycinis]